jgi:zinc transporter
MTSTASDVLEPSPARIPPAGPGLVPGLVWAFRVHPDGSADELPPDQPLDGHHDGWLWLHLNLADKRACHWLNTETELPAEAIRTLLSSDTHQVLHATDDCVYGVFTDIVRDFDHASDEFGHLRFAMTERRMISGRHHALHAIENTRQALRGGLRVPSVAALLEAIVTHVADAIDHVIDALAEELDGIEDRILLDQVRAERRRLGTLRRRAVRMHRQLAGLRALFHRLERDMTGAPARALRIGAAGLVQRLDGLDHEVVAIRDRAHLLHEEIAGRLAEESAGSLHILSIITTLLLPPTLVAGIFGMNTKGLPFTDNDTGFWWSMALLVLSAGAALWLLKRVGVLR